MDLLDHLFGQDPVDEPLGFEFAEPLELRRDDGGLKMPSSGSRAFVSCVEVTLIHNFDVRCVEISGEFFLDPRPSVHSDRSVRLLPSRTLRGL